MLGQKTVVATAALFALLLAAPIEAQAMRCGNRLVSRNDSRARVIAVCGHPDDVDSQVVYQTSGHVRRDIYGRYRQRYVVRQGFYGPRIEVPVQIEHWVYNFGSNRLMHRVIFANGRVARIESLGYGYDARRPPPPRNELRGGDDQWRRDGDRRRGGSDTSREHDVVAEPQPRAAQPRQPSYVEPWRRVRVEAAPEHVD